MRQTASSEGGRPEGGREIWGVDVAPMAVWLASLASLLKKNSLELDGWTDGQIEGQRETSVSSVYHCRGGWGVWGEGLFRIDSSLLLVDACVCESTERDITTHSDRQTRHVDMTHSSGGSTDAHTARPSTPHTHAHVAACYNRLPGLVVWCLMSRPC